MPTMPGTEAAQQLRDIVRRIKEVRQQRRALALELRALRTQEQQLRSQGVALRRRSRRPPELVEAERKRRELRKLIRTAPPEVVEGIQAYLKKVGLDM